MDSKRSDNPEIADIGTHMAGATDLHKTRHSDKPIVINPPVVPSPGPYDTRTEAFDQESNEPTSSRE